MRRGDRQELSLPFPAALNPVIKQKSPETSIPYGRVGRFLVRRAKLDPDTLEAEYKKALADLQKVTPGSKEQSSTIAADVVRRIVLGEGNE